VANRPKRLPTQTEAVDDLTLCSATTPVADTGTGTYGASAALSVLTTEESVKAQAQKVATLLNGANDVEQFSFYFGPRLASAGSTSLPRLQRRLRRRRHGCPKTRVPYGRERSVRPEA
jgi:hypothetical protein